MKGMQRLPLIACGMAIIACIGVIGVFGFQSKRIEELHREQADLMRRVSTTESVYDVQDCVLRADDEGCEMEEGESKLFLGAADKDGEVRWLKRKTLDGKEDRIGQLSKEETYVRIKHEDGRREGYVADREEGTVEVYLAQPISQPEKDERLPIMMRHVLVP